MRAMNETGGLSAPDMKAAKWGRIVTANMPVRRLGEPEDIAHACAWVCDERSSYVTGQSIGINGGRVVS